MAPDEVQAYIATERPHRALWIWHTADCRFEPSLLDVLLEADALGSLWFTGEDAQDACEAAEEHVYDFARRHGTDPDEIVVGVLAQEDPQSMLVLFSRVRDFGVIG